MGVQSGKGEGALDYSLDFKGGTATNREHLTKIIRSKRLIQEIVPVVEDVTGDHNVQAQKVKGQQSDHHQDTDAEVLTKEKHLTMRLLINLV